MDGIWNRSRFPVFCSIALVATFALGATVGISWSKAEVIPVVLVEPSIGGFSPIEGTSIGNTWSKSDVKPILLVKPGIGGFEPREGSSIGNTWRQDDVLPVVLVETSLSGFVPLRALSSGDQGPQEKGSTAPVPSVVEAQVDGDFEGWEGETLIKLTNGQIWEQTEYYYEYVYAFMPKAIVYRSGAGFKMKVDGSSRAIGVKRLK